MTMITTVSGALAFGRNPGRCSVTTRVNVYEIPLGGVNGGAVNVGFGRLEVCVPVSVNVIPTGAVQAYVKPTYPVDPLPFSITEVP